MPVHILLLWVLVTSQLLPAIGDSGPAPDSALRLHGQVKSVKRIEEKKAQTFDLELELTFENPGDEPVILLLGTYDIKQWWLLNRFVSVDPADQKVVLYVGGTAPGNSRSMKKWSDLRRQLDKPSPPKHLTYVLGPGEKFQHRLKTFVTISEVDYKLLKQPVWLRLQLEMWPGNIENGSDGEAFHTRLNRKWTKKGALRVKSIVSEPILLNLAAWASP